MRRKPLHGRRFPARQPFQPLGVESLRIIPSSPIEEAQVQAPSLDAIFDALKASGRTYPESRAIPFEEWVRLQPVGFTWAELRAKLPIPGSLDKRSKPK